MHKSLNNHNFGRRWSIRILTLNTSLTPPLTIPLTLRDERPNVRFVCDPDVAYVLLRYRQVHDFWHVLCDLPPTVLGELALKWFEWRQTGLPSCGLSTLSGPLRLNPSEIYLMNTVYIRMTFIKPEMVQYLILFLLYQQEHGGSPRTDTSSNHYID